ncbi:MAG: glycosyltransferase [Bacteroidales bacterium]|nr:glycosyltransferase [Bacteroidales bacterium]MDT8373839.1 glycosyltransferase [Bacteroidales bacterium]
MDGRRILISPLNWGFGHAGRMIPLAAELKRRGNEVIFGVDKSLIPLVRSELPGISVTEIRGLRIRYSRHLPQYICIFLQLPRIMVASVREYYDLRRLASRLLPDLIISDSRFGFRHRKICSVYVTHQLRIAFPVWLRLMEPLGVRLHRMISSRFDHCLVPDYPGPANLSGRLSHDLPLPENICYCGPLSRFGGTAGSVVSTPATARNANDTSTHGASAHDTSTYDTSTPGTTVAVASATSGLSESASTATSANTATSSSPAGSVSASATSGRKPPRHPFCCLIMSGPEPQRSILLEKVTAAVTEMPLVILSTTPLHPESTGNQEITVVTNPDTATIRSYLLEAALIISRAGYTTIMELASLNRGAILIPTPGQTEQEYLGMYLNGRLGFVTVSQRDIMPAAPRRHSSTADALTGFSNNPADLFTNSNPLVSGVEPPGVASPDRKTKHAGAELPDAAPLLEKALDVLLEKEE